MTITLTREEAQQVLDALENPYASRDNIDDAAETLRARLAQPEPEQLGEIVPADEEQLKRIEKLVQPEPEPMAWTVGGLITDFSRDFSAYKTQTYTRPLYTAPPQREWQGLTDEEVREMPKGETFYDFARAIEAKLKEKNI